MKEPMYTQKPKGGNALFFEVPSATIPDKTYTVRVMPDGEIRCSCIANTFNSTCTHLRYFEKMYNPKYEKLVKDITPEDMGVFKESLKPPKKEKLVKEKKGEEFYPHEKVVAKGFADDFPF